jgi:RNase P subunit RPR2
MKETVNYREDVAELAISVTNELARCACSHCVDIYIRGEEEHFSSKANQIEIKCSSNNSKHEYEQIDDDDSSVKIDHGKILSTVECNK